MMFEPKIYHQCEKGVLRPYPSVLCSLCRTPKNEDDHYVKAVHYTATKKDLEELHKVICQINLEMGEGDEDGRAIDHLSKELTEKIQKIAKWEMSSD